MEIIKCNNEDIPALAEFFDRVVEHLEKNINYPKWERGKYPAEESIRGAVGNGTQYACMENGAVIGAFVLDDNPFGNYESGEWRKNLSRGEYLVIHALATAHDAHNRGIAKYMVTYCIEKAKTMGYKAIRLDAVPENIPARRLYEGMGFEFAGEKDLLREVDIPLFALYELNFE